MRIRLCPACHKKLTAELFGIRWENDLIEKDEIELEKGEKILDADMVKLQMAATKCNLYKEFGEDEEENYVEGDSDDEEDDEDDHHKS
jgi:hypothetical protein